MTGPPAPTGIDPGTMSALMLSVFTVSMGFGIILPLLPDLIERMLGAGTTTAEVSRSTGLLTALYTFSLFLFAPVWGFLSDRHGRRLILLIGLLGFSATMLTSAFIDSLSAVYAERFFSGLFAAAVTPVALATIGDLAKTNETRARRLTMVSLAGISGFLIGPMLGVFIAKTGAGMIQVSGAAGSIALPLAVTAMVALAAALAVAVSVRHRAAGDPALMPEPHDARAGRWAVPTLLALSFIVAAGIGVFEVGLALRGKQNLGLSQYQIALLFTECSLVMLIVQAIVFSPWIKPAATSWIIAPAMIVMAAGLFLVPRAMDLTMMMVVIGAVAASAGILSPIFTFWISNVAGVAQGAELGLQTSAASLGAATGSAAGGLLFDVAWLPDASFILATLLLAAGAIMSLHLPGTLARYNPGNGKLPKRRS